MIFEMRLWVAFFLMDLGGCWTLLHAASRTPACSLRNSARRSTCTDTQILRKTPQRHSKSIFLRLSFYNQIDKHLLNKLPETLKNGTQVSGKPITIEPKIV